MKSLILATLLISTSAFSLDFKEIAGKYSVSPDYIPMSTIISISEDGVLSLTEETLFGSYTCTGQAEITNFVLSSNVSCTNGDEFYQEVDLTEVEDFSEFRANVYTSLYDKVLPMNFVKID